MQRSNHSNMKVSETAIQGALRAITNGVRYPDFWKKRYGEDQESEGQVECEACGQRFEPTQGYYEPGEYAYCSECCHW